MLLPNRSLQPLRSVPVPPPFMAMPDQVHDGAASESLPSGTVSAADPDLIRRLAEESWSFDGTGADPERNCWLVVHRHAHGVLPSEYDIREIDEDLYLAVLAARRAAEGDQALNGGLPRSL